MNKLGNRREQTSFIFIFWRAPEHLYGIKCTVCSLKQCMYPVYSATHCVTNSCVEQVCGSCFSLMWMACTSLKPSDFEATTLQFQGCSTDWAEELRSNKWQQMTGLHKTMSVWKLHLLLNTDLRHQRVTERDHIKCTVSSHDSVTYSCFQAVLYVGGQEVVTIEWMWQVPQKQQAVAVSYRLEGFRS